MSAADTVKDVVRIANTAGLAKDAIDLLEKKSTLLTDQVAALENENAQLKLENIKLRQQLQNHQPVAVTQRLTAEEHAILEVLETEARNWKDSEVAVKLQTDVGRIRALFIKLRAENYIYEVLNGFCIDDKGRAALHGTS